MKVTVEWVALPLHILQVTGSNQSPEMRYPWGFVGEFSPSKQILEYCLHLVKGCYLSHLLQFCSHLSSNDWLLSHLFHLHIHKIIPTANCHNCSNSIFTKHALIAACHICSNSIFTHESHHHTTLYSSGLLTASLNKPWFKNKYIMWFKTKWSKEDLYSTSHRWRGKSVLSQSWNYGGCVGLEISAYEENMKCTCNFGGKPLRKWSLGKTWRWDDNIRQRFGRLWGSNEDGTQSKDYPRTVKGRIRYGN